MNPWVNDSVFLSSSRKPALLWAVALLLAAGTAFLDLRLGDISITLVVTLALAMLLGCLAPRRAWRWGFLFGMFPPGAHLLFRTLLHGDSVVDAAPALAVLVPAFVGAYLGAFLNTMVRGLMGHE